MPLAMLKSGEFGMSCRLHGQDKEVKHLEDMRFVSGETVKVISEISGNLIVEIKGARLAMNKVTANRIILAS